MFVRMMKLRKELYQEQSTSRYGEVSERVGELDKSKSYIIICRSGGRSGRATEFLEDAGYDAANMTGGMLEWEGETE